MSKILPSFSRDKSPGENHSNSQVSNSRRCEALEVSGCCSKSRRSSSSCDSSMPKDNHNTADVAPQGSSSSIASTGMDLASLFECPVCFDYALPPIMQCQSGHIVCSACRPKLTTCPSCRGALDNIRNLAMEKLAATVKFPCKYHTYGCHVTLSHRQKALHESACELRPYACPCPGASCKWSGPLDQVLHHLLMQHKSITRLQGEDIVFLATDIHLPGAVDWVMMQSCYNQHFILVLEKQDRHIMMAPSNANESLPPTTSNVATVGPMGASSVTIANSLTNEPTSSNNYSQVQQYFAMVLLIGSPEQAESFAYRLELHKGRQRLAWEANPRSIHEGVQAAITTSDCLLFDGNVANQFSEKGNLAINVTISQISTI